jgi:MFS family permease
VEALRDRSFQLLFAARAVSYVGTYLAPIAVAFAVLDLGGSATEVGLSFAAWTVAQVATLAFGGVIGDRFPRRVVMIASDTASFAVRAAMGALLVSGHAEVWELIALQACGGAAVAFYSPASYGLVNEVVRTELLQQANSLLGIARYAAFPLGAAAGGTIVATVGSGTALLFDAGTYGASALLPAGVRVRSLAGERKRFFHELREAERVARLPRTGGGARARRPLRRPWLLVRLDRLAHDAPEDHRARQAGAGCGLQLDERDGIPARRLRACRSDRGDGRNAGVPPLRRRVACREHALPSLRLRSVRELVDEPAALEALPAVAPAA